MTYNIAVVGLGYVGAPLWHALSQHFPTVGYDLNSSRVEELNRGVDTTGELSESSLISSKSLFATDNLSDIKNCNVYILTVPTPINNHKKPDLSFLKFACSSIGELLDKDDLVIFESTVYPGCTEEVCIPILEQYSKLAHLFDFNVGYSPERINPGDKTHRLSTVTKVISADSVAALSKVASIYEKIVSAGLYKAANIRTAEAAKIIENTQRDVNIALINELAMLFEKLEIDTQDVLEAAATKWNFLPFKPGLVGGHCIGVDPYYLAHKAESVGFEPKMILSGRYTNEKVVDFIIEKVRSECKSQSLDDEFKILIMGATFKENVPDFRNSKAIEIAKKLSEDSFCVYVHDPFHHLAERKFRDLHMIDDMALHKYNLIIIAVGHDQYSKIPLDNIKNLLKPNGKIYDLKGIYPKDRQTYRL